jgi:hypothetical protein
MAARQTMHKMTAEVQLVASVDHCDHKAGMFGDPTDGWSWSVIPQPNRRVHLVFNAPNGPDALMLAHRLMQRHARGRSNPNNLRAKRAKYGPCDYAIIELRHEGTGPYDLPGGPNPDLSPKKRESKVNNQLEMEGV